MKTIITITHHESIILIKTIIDDGYPGSSKVAISGNPPSEMEVSSWENQRTKYGMFWGYNWIILDLCLGIS